MNTYSYCRVLAPGVRIPERPERGRPRTEAVACVLSTVPAQISTDGHERRGVALAHHEEKDKPDDGRALEHQQSANAGAGQGFRKWGYGPREGGRPHRRLDRSERAGTRSEARRSLPWPN